MPRGNVPRNRQLSFFKTCPSCGESKLRTDFVRNRSTWDGLGAYCKPCHNVVIKTNHDRLYGSRRNFLLNLRYGVTEEQVDRMIADRADCVPSAGSAPRNTSITTT